MMTPTQLTDDLSSISNLSDAINVIKFLKISHKAELAKWRDACHKQAKIIKKLESNRHQELTFLSNQLHKYESDLTERENAIAKELNEKNKTIDELNETVKSLQIELNILRKDSFVKTSRCESSDSGIFADKTEDESVVTKCPEGTHKKRHSSFRKSINFFRKVDFSPKILKKSDIPSSNKPSSFRRAAKLWKPLEKTSSEEEFSSPEDAEFFTNHPRKMDESMNNHYCEVPNEIEREQLFDRVMTRNSVRRSVKSNSKYQKISRNKSKYLKEIRSVCEYDDSS